jgi:hypothetical protein
VEGALNHSLSEQPWSRIFDLFEKHINLLNYIKSILFMLTKLPGKDKWDTNSAPINRGTKWIQSLVVSNSPSTQHAYKQFLDQ